MSCQAVCSSVAIAQALMMQPKILLMDEPFGALDHNTRLAMQLLILEQWEDYRMTIIFVTHDLEEACYVGTRVIGLSQYWSDDEGKPGVGAVIVTICPRPRTPETHGDPRHRRVQRAAGASTARCARSYEPATIAALQSHPSGCPEARAAVSCEVSEAKEETDA